MVEYDRDLIAVFQYSSQSYTINASSDPSDGGTVSGGGTYNSGETCTLVATSNTGYEFVNWTENGNQVSSNPTYSFTVNANRTLVAHFQIPSYVITASASPVSGGTVSGGGTYNSGQICTVVANASSSYSFVNWTENGSPVSNSSSYSFPVTGNRNLVANFQYSPAGYTITVTSDPVNGGLVSGAGTYNQGETCTLIATANSGYHFLNWTENNTIVSTQASYSFMVNGNRNLVAHFGTETYVINAMADPVNGGTVLGGGTYMAGINCRLIALPNSNYIFLNWTENDVVISNDSEYDFVVDGNRNLVAHFYYFDGLEDNVDNSITIHPNPTRNNIIVEGNGIEKVDVYSILGQLLVSLEKTDEMVILNLQNVESGIYLVRVITKNGIVVKRVVKE